MKIYIDWHNMKWYTDKEQLFEDLIERGEFNSYNDCGDCPFATVCDSAAVSSLSMSEFMKGLLSKVVIKE